MHGVFSARRRLIFRSTDQYIINFTRIHKLDGTDRAVSCHAAPHGAQKKMRVSYEDAVAPFYLSSRFVPASAII